MLACFLPLKDLQEQIQRSFKVGVGYGWPLRSQKELVALTKQVSDLLIWSSGPIGLPFKRKKDLGYGHQYIAHDIRTPLTIASGYTQQIIKGGTQEEENWRKLLPIFKSSQNAGISLLEYRRLMEGAIQPRLSDVNLNKSLTQLFQYYDSLSVKRGLT